MRFSNCSEENLLYQPKYFTEWRSEVLYGLAKWKNGLAFKKINFSNNGKPVIKIAELKNGLSAQTKYTRDEFDKSVFLTKGDMVFSWSGNPETSIDIFWYSLPDGWLNQHIFKVTVDNGIDEKFFYYILKFLKPNFTAIASNKQTTGLGHVTIGDLKNIIVKLPELEEQKAIAHILSTLDDKIEVNNQINRTLENMAQAIFKQWFVDFEFPNEDGEQYKSSGGEMVESELGMIPKGWEVGKFIDLIEITSGKRPGKRSDLAMEDCKYPLVGASSIMGYTDDFNFEEKILVIGRVGTHGVVQRFNNKVWASDNTLVIKSDNYEFAYQILNQIDYKAINRGSTQPLITQTDIKNYTLIIPTEGYLNKFELLVGSLFEIHSNHCIENSKLTEIRDSLLPKLMSGEIRVPLDEDGDAS